MTDHRTSTEFRNRRPSATDRALVRVANGEHPNAAADAEGLARSTVYRALKRRQARRKASK